MMLSTSVWNASGRWSRPESRYTIEDEALPAGRDDGRRYVRGPDVGDGPHVRDLRHLDRVGPRRSRPDGDRRWNVVGQISAMASQSRAAKCAQKRSSTRLAAFSSRGAGRLSSSNRASAASRSASSNSSQRLIRSPSTVKRLISRHSASKPSCEVPLRRLGDDRSEVAQPMHSLDVDAEVRREVPRGTDVCSHVAGREPDPSPVVDVHPVRRRRGKFAPVELRRRPAR